MNLDTGHLVANIEDVEEHERKMYDRLYGENANEAKKLLNGRKDAFVDLTKKTRLSNMARNKKKKAKKMAKKQRIKNAKKK